jgi:hypothetical protein
VRCGASGAGGCWVGEWEASSLRYGAGGVWGLEVRTAGSMGSFAAAVEGAAGALCVAELASTGPRCTGMSEAFGAAGQQELRQSQLLECWGGHWPHQARPMCSGGV